DWKDFVNRLNPVASALMAKMHIAAADRPQVKAECLRLLISLDLDPARTELISTFVSTYLRLNAAESRRFEQRVAEFVPPQKEQALRFLNEWHLKGIEIGKVEGKVEGRVEEAQRIARLQLPRRVGNVSEHQETRIRRLTLEQL